MSVNYGTLTSEALAKRIAALEQRQFEQDANIDYLRRMIVTLLGEGDLTPDSGSPTIMPRD